MSLSEFYRFIISIAVALVYKNEAQNAGFVRVGIKSAVGRPMSSLPLSLQVSPFSGFNLNIKYF
jgi:hypothetical protein